jgi:hypothetical protein
MQIASFLHYIVLSSAACLALPYFSKLCNKQHDFQENVFVSIFCTPLSETFLNHRRIPQDIINVYVSSCKVAVILFEF